MLFRSLEEEFKNIAHSHHQSVDAGHGRIEERKCWVVKAEPEHIPSMRKWNGLENIVAVESKRTTGEKVSSEIRYFITSAKLDAEKALHITRSHWGVESMHWTLDVSFGEDKSRVRADSSPENLGIMRHIALNILKRDNTRKISMPRKRKFAALEDKYRETLLKNGLNIS